MATHEDDSRFDDFQKIADTQAITIGVGVPLKVDAGICIGMVIFHPHKKRQVYSKKYLHADETPFFVSGQNVTDFMAHKPNMALAICYELSVPEHADHAFRQGAKVYIVSVAKFKNGIEKAQQRLSEIAKRYFMTVLMSNCIGISDGGECAGRTSVWKDDGKLVAELDGMHEGILIFNTKTQDVILKVI